MNVKFENRDDQTALITVSVAQADYNEAVEKALKNYRKTAKVPGFRPGMVPMTLINKMYRKGTIAEQSYKLASDAAFKHLQENEINALGDLMPASEQGQIDFENGTDFEFIFKIGIAPEVKLSFTKKDKVEKIVIEPSAEMLDGYRDNLLRSYGSLVDVDVVASDEALNVTLDNGDMQIEDTYLSLISLDEDKRKPFMGKKVGDKIEVDVNELYPDAKQRAAILSVKESELETLNPKFSMEITKIRKFENPKLDDEFFAKAYPNKDVTNVEQFEAKVKEGVQEELNAQTIFRFQDAVRDMAIKKAALTFPDEFMKEWLLAINEGKFTMEQIEVEYPQFEEMMKWDVVKRAVGKDNEIKVTEEDVVAEAKNMAAQQFRYYGMANATDDMLDGFAKQILSDKEQGRKIADRVGENKIIDAIVAKITVNEKSLTVEQFTKMMQKEQEAK